MEGRGGVVQGKHQSYTLSTASEDERDSWIHAIRSEHVHVSLRARSQHCQTEFGFMFTFITNKSFSENISRTSC